jgi:hypothetical protein
MEQLFIGVWKLVNPLLWGGAAKYKSVTAVNIAKAMVWLANYNYPDVIVTSDKINELAVKQ